MMNNNSNEVLSFAQKMQRKASDPKYSVWVEASAGTGKTKVLTDRVLRLLLEGVNPAKILCLTYTKAAASNMQERITSRLSRWAVASGEELKKDLREICGEIADNEIAEQCSTARRLFAACLDMAEGMKIQTIHSFCQDILKRFPIEAKVSPYFEVMDDRKSAEILEKIKKDILDSPPNEDCSKALVCLTEKVSEYTFPSVLKKITQERTKIEDFLSRYKSFSEMQNAIASSLGLNFDETEENIKKQAIEEVNITQAQKVVEALKHGAKTDNKNAETLEKIINIESEDNYEKYKEIFLTEGQIRKRLVSKGAQEYNPQVLDFMQAEAQRIKAVEEKIRAAQLLSSTLCLLKIAIELIGKYNDYKERSSRLDYEDLIIITKKLLLNCDVADWVMYKLDGGISHILVDEAQDNSAHQWDIIRSLSAEFFAGEGAKKQNRTVFAVGDRKQSIYGFQGANPEKFENMRKYFSEKSQNFRTVNMEVSFRSAPAVLNAVNTVFKSEKNKRGVVPVEQKVEHLPYNANWGGKVEVWKIEENLPADTLEPEDFDFTKPTPSSVLAKKLAFRIKNMVLKKEYLSSKKRSVKYSDFMVLVRSRTGHFLPEFLHECQNIGVPTEGADRMSLLEQIAVQDLISLGKFLLLPTDDLTLAELLKSPLFGLNDYDLIKICAKRGNASVWSRLGDFPEYSHIYNDLQTLLNKVDFMRPYELYNLVLSKMEGRKKFVERMGREVEDCLDEFVNLTISFETENIPSLQNFISWVEADDVIIKRELEQTDNNAVKIMTVHGSKGLQAPIVILPDTTSIAKRKHSMDILSDDFLYSPLSSQEYAQKCEEIYQKEQQKELNEYRRLLYVAMTRAEDRLCVCGYKKKNTKLENSWYEMCMEELKKIGKEIPELVEYEEGSIGDLSKDEGAAVEKKIKLPNFGWLKNPAPIETPLAKPYRPSIDSDEEDEAGVSPIASNEEYRYRRGTLMHKILQFIGDIPENLRETKIKEFLQKNAPEMSEKSQKSIIFELLELLQKDELKFVFGENSKPEVAIMGEVDGKIISAQLDRLAVDNDKVIVVDFKTNRPAAENLADLPQLYKKQMSAYKQLLERIYPKKEVVVYILWTNTATLMKIV